MKTILCFLIVFISIDTTQAQYKLYFSAGSNTSGGLYIDGFYQAGKGNYIWHTDGKYQNSDFGKYWIGDLLLEKRINKTIYGVTGIQVSQVGYHNSFDTNYSDFKCTYVGLPLLVRANLVNGFMIDIGPVLRVPVVADLKETALMGSVYETSDHQNIANYLSTVSLGWTWQNTLFINRYSICFYFSGGKTLVSDQLASHWALGGNLRNNSLFLRDIQPKYVYQMIGLKIGIRIR